MAGWHARGIPLGIVLEVLEDLFSKKRKTAPPRSLAYVAGAVEEAWEAIRSGRIVPSPEAEASRGKDPIELWRRARDDPASPSALRQLLDRLIREVEAGKERRLADRVLDEALVSVAPPTMVAQASAEAEGALEEGGETPSDRDFRRSPAAVIVERLRRRIGLPRLAREEPSSRP